MRIPSEYLQKIRINITPENIEMRTENEEGRGHKGKRK
jgi:hypothetical protein